jgi:hypothetical protein
MQVETSPPGCGNPWCSFPAHFDVSDDGIDSEPYCSPICGDIMRWLRVAEVIPECPERRQLVATIVMGAELLSERKNPRDPDPELSQRIARVLAEVTV